MSDVITNTGPVPTITDAPYISLTSRMAEATNSAEKSSLIDEINSYIVTVYLPNADAAAASTADTQNPNDATQTEAPETETETATATATATETATETAPETANGSNEVTTQAAQGSSEDVLDPDDALTSMMSNANAGTIEESSTIPGTTIQEQTILGSTAANSYVEASTELGMAVQGQEQTSVYVYYSGSDNVESSVPTGLGMGVGESMQGSLSSEATSLPGASSASVPALPDGSDIPNYSNVPSGMPGLNGSMATNARSGLETSPTEYYFPSGAGSNAMNLPSGTFHAVTSVPSESGRLMGPSSSFRNATPMPTPPGMGQNQTFLPSSSNAGMGNASGSGNTTGISPPGIGNAACDPHYGFAASSLALMITFFF